MIKNVNETQPLKNNTNCRDRLKRKKKQRNLNLASNKKNQKLCMIVILIENIQFFSTRYSMTQTLLHFSNKIQPSPLKDKKIPPFQILEPLLKSPSDLASKSHTNIFL
jgi:hypothetical protein